MGLWAGERKLPLEYLHQWTLHIQRLLQLGTAEILGHYLAVSVDFSQLMQRKRTNCLIFPSVFIVMVHLLFTFQQVSNIVHLFNESACEMQE